jgi:2-C-methyl-D-erythritol 4-phosphate cytidylyltransferase
MEVWAVLVAAGRGERLGGGRPKAFAPLAGRPLLAESLQRLDACASIDAIVVVAPPGWEEPAILLAEELGAAKVSSVVAGGTRSRSESVRLGVEEVAGEADAIVVHDAARPLVSDEVVARVLGALEGCEGAVPGLPIADTVKRAPAGVVSETVDRSDLYLVQTPQGFRADVFRRALAAWDGDATDCSGYVERAGGRVTVVQGDAALLKVTGGDDLAAVERILQGEAP